MDDPMPFSSESGEWCEPSTLEFDYYVEILPPVLVGGAMHFLCQHGLAILGYDLYDEGTCGALSGRSGTTPMTSMVRLSYRPGMTASYLLASHQMPFTCGRWRFWVSTTKMWDGNLSR
jgi:hypothetical protein